jgi:hypothetical protein
MVAGEKEQFKLLGIPAHERVMGVLKAPDCEVAVMVKLPVWPTGIVIAEGEAAKATVGAGAGVGGVVVHAELYCRAPLI